MKRSAECDGCGQRVEVARTDNQFGPRFYEHKDPETRSYCGGSPKLETMEEVNA